MVSTVYSQTVRECEVMGRVAVVENALIIPGQRHISGLGVLTETGDFVGESTIWRGDAPLFEAPSPTTAEVALGGTHLFGGIMSWHFGHFVVESLSRLWPLMEDRHAAASVLFVPKGPANKPRSQAKFQNDLLDLIIPGISRDILRVPTRVERLIVPEQGFGTGDLEAGLPQFRRFISSRQWPEPLEDSPKRLYVTRDGLDRHRKGRIIGDLGLSKFVEDRGYTVLRPEKITLEDQIRLYRGARRILFEEGSAVHLFGLVARPGQTAGVIQRRVAESEAVVGQRQLRAFAGIDLKLLDAVIREWRPSHLGRATSKSHGELEPNYALEALRGFGVAKEGDIASDLGLPTRQEATEAMARLDYVAVDRPTPLPDTPTIATYWGARIPTGPHLTPKRLRSLRDGFYERQELRSAFTFFTSTDRVLELGAGAGIVGSAVALNCEVTELLSYEANSEMIPIVRGVFERNGLHGKANVRHAIVVSDKNSPETVPFAVESDYLGSSMIGLGAIPSREARIEQVPTVQLSDVIAEFRPNALLMDIEGAELPFLLGADLSGFDKVIVELHRGIYGRDGMRKCRSALTAGGLTQQSEYCRRGVETWMRV